MKQNICFQGATTKNARRAGTPPLLVPEEAMSSSGVSKLHKPSLRLLRRRRNSSTPPLRPSPQRRRPTTFPPKPIIPLLSDLKSTADVKTALDLFYSAPPHDQDYPSCCHIIYRLARARDFQAVDALLEHIQSCRVRCKDTIFNALIKHYGRYRLPDKAMELFHSIPSFNCAPNSPTLQSFNFLLDALVESGETENAENMLRRSREMGIRRPNVVSYNVVIKGKLAVKDMSGACKVLDEMIKRGVDPSTVTYNMMIGFLCRSGGVDKAMGLKEKMSRNDVRPNAVTYALLMEGLCLEGKYGNARKMLFDMDYWGCKPSLVNYGVLMSDRCRNGKFDEARELLAEMKKRKYKPDVVTYNILMNFLCKEGRVDEAYRLMVEIQVGGSQPDAAMYRVMLDSFCRVGEFEKGMGVLNAMLVSGHCPREETFRCLVSGLCNLSGWSDVSLVMSEMEKRRIGLDLAGWETLVGNTCGCLGAETGILDDLIMLPDK